jgi:hypothetical protein
MGKIKNFLVTLSATIILFGNPLQAQTRTTPNITKLSCSGSSRYYTINGDTPTSSFDINGIFLEISASSVKIIGIPKLSTPINGSVYNILNINEQFIGFKNIKNSNQSGTINKITGDIFVYEIAERGLDGSLKFSSSFSGTCVPYKPIF